MNDNKKPRHCTPLRGAAVIAVTICLATACTQSHKTDTLSSNFDPETTPTMVTRPVTTLLSDSGITRYRITAPVWYVYDEAKEPRWTFPEGMDMEKFDDLFRQEATVRCDSAVYYSTRQLWRLDGYVHIRNVAGQQFLTNQLYWDQKTKKIYSDSFIHILRDDRVIEGYGFESDEQMNHYRIRQVQGIFPVSQFQSQQDDDTAPGNPTPTYPDSTPATTGMPALDNALNNPTPPPVSNPSKPKMRTIFRPGKANAGNTQDR